MVLKVIFVLVGLPLTALSVITTLVIIKSGIEQLKKPPDKSSLSREAESASQECDPESR